MTILSRQMLLDYRARSFRSSPSLRVNTIDEAVDFVNRSGFVFFWPVKDVLMPSLWVAAAGDRPVPDEHDDPGHKTWSWKDRLLGKRRWYYSRVLRRRNTIISLDDIPYFYALSPNFGDPDNDYLQQYEQGRLTNEARKVYAALLKEGPLDTIHLRQASQLASASSNTRFNRALEDLQIELKIMPVGISDAGAWHYAFIYDIVTRHMPEIQEKARFISDEAARQRIAGDYFRSVGAAPNNYLNRLFRWSPEECEDTLDRLERAGVIHRNIQVEGETGAWDCMRDLVTI
ncbi:MAG: crosslink repair DNA glycosylase YcaQ family protein [Anaerolineaceae bacterium]